MPSATARISSTGRSGSAARRLLRSCRPVFQENEVHSPYTRTLSDPGGENVIVMFKSCFPNSGDMGGSPNDPPAEPDGSLSVGTAKGVYNDLLEYFKTRPDKLFVVITAPPVQDRTNAANARAFDTWLMNNWLKDANYPYANVAVWDFYNVLTGRDHHHRVNNGQIEYTTKASENTLVYPSEDDHPNPQGSRKATEEFLPMLNVFYNRWMAAGGAEAAPAEAAPAEPAVQPAPQKANSPKNSLHLRKEANSLPEVGMSWMISMPALRRKRMGGWFTSMRHQTQPSTVGCSRRMPTAENLPTNRFQGWQERRLGFVHTGIPG